MPLHFRRKGSGKGDKNAMRVLGEEEASCAQVGKGREGARAARYIHQRMGGSLRGCRMRILPTIRSSLGGSGDARDGQWVEMTTRHAASLRSLVEGAHDKCFGIPTGKAAARELRMLCVWGARREGGARTARRIHQRNGRMFAGMPEHHPS